MFSKVLNMCYIATPGRLYESRDCRDTSATTGDCQAYQGCIGIWYWWDTNKSRYVEIRETEGIFKYHVSENADTADLGDRGGVSLIESWHC